MRAIIAGTGPSLTPEVIQQIRCSRLPVYGCNNTYQVLRLTALLACNIEWWDHYYPRDPQLRLGSFGKWTWDKPTADKYGIAYIRGEWGDGLSTDPNVIHYGHSSGYQLINLALHHGVTEFVLIGYDLKYAGGYDPLTGNPGSGRHYWEGGEYPKELQHWTRTDLGPNGELQGLLKFYKTINPAKYGIRIVNCSPDSALNFFENGDLGEWI